MHKLRSIGEDVVIDICVFQGRVGIVVDSVGNEDQSEENGEENDSGGGMEEAGC